MGHAQSGADPISFRPCTVSLYAWNRPQMAIFGGFWLPGAPGVFMLVQDGSGPLVHCPTLCHSPPRFHSGLWNPKSGENLARNVQKMLILGSILGVSASQKPQGCSSWSTMVAGHWYTVPLYTTALPGSIVGFKIPTLAKIWPEMPLKCSLWH